MSHKYKDYFNIDENYFPSVNEELIDKGLVDWTKFYPHETFKNLLKDTAAILRREQPLNIWIWGAYGTGKSHAALTLKKLLDAPAEETKKYFEDFGLSMDLFNKIQGAKNQGTVLTVHKYGVYDISNDESLAMVVQESIKKALIEKNIEFTCDISLKESIIAKLKDKVFAEYFDSLIRERYSVYFGDNTSEDLIRKLETYLDKDISGIIENIFIVAAKEGITAFKLGIDGLILWIKEVISKNNLKSLVFIWDEFSNYFKNHKNALTGFQKLLELSQTTPFHIIIVTHQGEGAFHDTDNEKTQILGRFIKPTCKIELPENMAFKLMGAAMQKKEDEHIRAEWNEYSEELNAALSESRRVVMESAKIDTNDLKGILPIHPYTAILLKHLSSAFESNQRSMFDFIKNNKGEDHQGLKWFIENYGFEDDCNLLTIDMLWQFFYENGKDNLEPGVRNILDSYYRESTQYLDNDMKRVLKTVLLLQAISDKTRNVYEIFSPNEKNLANAYDGTDLGSDRAKQIAKRLVRDEILFERAMGNGKTQYSALINAGDTVAIEKIMAEIKANKKTKDIVESYNVQEFLNLSGALKLRYVVKSATIDNISRIVGEIRNRTGYYFNTIPVVAVFAKEEAERSAIIAKIRELVKSDEQEIIFIDTSLCSLGIEGFDEFAKCLANCAYQTGKDNGQANRFNEMAADVIKKWKDRLATSQLVVVTKDQGEEKVFSVESLHIKLKEINKKKFPMGIENYTVQSTMFDFTTLKQGAKCGAGQAVVGTYKSGNPAMKLEKALDGAWMLDNYWETNKSILISQIKIELEKFIGNAFDKDGKVSIVSIYDKLKVAPFGFMPCNLSAFMLGFLLKEYAKEEFSWSDEQVSESMSIDKLAEMIDEVIKLQNMPNNRYKEKYIVKMTESEKAFREATSTIFDIPLSQCVTIPSTRDRIRAKMKEIGFPIWGACSIIESENHPMTKSLNSLIAAYCGVANSSEVGTSKSEIDFALEVGRACVENQSLAMELKKYITKDKCRTGMLYYLNEFNNGELKDLAEKIGSSDKLIKLFKDKLDADSAAWVWYRKTIDDKIREIILEHKIIEQSNKIVAKAIEFKEVIFNWCDKLEFFRLPYDGIKNDLREAKPLFDCLIDIFRTRNINDNIKAKFLEQLTLFGTNFNQIFDNQFMLFKSICDFQLNGLSDEHIEKVFKSIPHGMFGKSNAEYTQIASNLIEKYKKNLRIVKLRELWSEKTGTTSPRDWSEKYTTPILCMIEKDYERAKNAFNTLNRSNPDEVEITKAIDFLEQADFFDNLNDENNRNKCFVDKVIDEYKAILDDVAAVRKELTSRLICDVYDWYPSPEVKNIIKKYAEIEYNTKGCEKALQKIEDMDADRLKVYLKQLIRDNLKVGIEIINDR